MIANDFQSLGAVETLTRRELVLDRLRQAVTSNELPPGTHLTEIDLSSSLGVSRGTLREALRHLQEEGLLTKDGRGRLFVRTLSPKEVEETFDVRYALEGMAASVICALSNRDQALKAINSALEHLSESENAAITEQVAADLAFHETICRESGNQTLLRSWQRVSGLSRAVITAAGAETAMENVTAERHRPIAEAIASGDTDRARAAIWEHTHSAKLVIVERMRARLD